jgi:hypothetical protein
MDRHRIEAAVSGDLEADALFDGLRLAGTGESEIATERQLKKASPCRSPCASSIARSSRS